MTKLCGIPLKTLYGKPRGFCLRLYKHCGPHGNNLCTMCGIQVRPTRHSWCHGCQKINRRSKGIAPPLRQRAGEFWVFSCGCRCVLPSEGESNKFARWDGSIKHGVFAHYCRAAIIISSNIHTSRRGGYKSISPNTPHSVIWALAKEKDCWRCHKPLVWDLGLSKTPHLHHDHRTGEIFGFTHPKCNLHALEDEIEELKIEIRRLKSGDNVSRSTDSERA